MRAPTPAPAASGADAAASAEPSVQFLMSGSADAIAEAVLRMQTVGWRFLSEAEEVRSGVWSMLVVRPPVPAPRRER